MANASSAGQSYSPLRGLSRVPFVNDHDVKAKIKLLTRDRLDMVVDLVSGTNNPLRESDFGARGRYILKGLGDRGDPLNLIDFPERGINWVISNDP